MNDRRSRPLTILISVLLLGGSSAQAWRWGLPGQLTTTPENSLLPSYGTGFAGMNGHLHVLCSDWSRGEQAVHYLRSSDGGMNWQPPVVVEDRSMNSTFSVAADSSGDVHVVNRRYSDFALHYRRSADSGAVWDSAVLFSNACENVLLLSNRQSNVYIFNVVPGLPPALEMYKSTDGGATWTQGARVLYSQGFSNLCGYATGSGAIDVFYCWGGAGSSTVYRVRSTDDGATWSDETRVRGIPTNSSVRGAWRNGDLVFLATTTWEDTVNFRRSTDGGDTWRSGQRLPVLVNSVAWSQDGAAHAVGTRADTEVVWLMSTNQGATWTAPVPISGHEHGYRASPYIAADDQYRLNAVWNSSETGNWEVFTTFADTTGIAEPAGGPLSPVCMGVFPNPARGVVRFGGTSGAVLFDRDGRRVAELKSGANDVSHLAPGIYFVRSASSAGRGASSVRKVIIAR